MTQHRHSGNEAETDRKRPVTTTLTSFRILEYLMDADGATLSQIAQDLEFAKSTVHRHLSTLDSEGYAIKEGEIYYPGLRWLEFGEYVRTRRSEYQIVRDKIDQISEETGGRAIFLVEEHGLGVYMYTTLGDHPVQIDPGVGKRIPLHAPAGGKAILSALPDERVDEIIDRHGLPKLTENTITDRDQLFEELEKTRERGYAINDEEAVKGLRAIGASIAKPSGEFLGSIAISGPTHRVTGDRLEERLPNVLLSAKTEIELNISSDEHTESLTQV